MLGGSYLNRWFKNNWEGRQKCTTNFVWCSGADSFTLLRNMKKLSIDVELNKGAEVYPPASFRGMIPGRKVITVTESTQVCEDVFSAGELKGMEQFLALKTGKGILVVVGYSHPGGGDIIDAAFKFGKVYGIVGGFHDFKRLNGLLLICHCYCTIV
jgi:7,8-dihydropterin-6-yl-methyl-4-(beta-D-ribofuranosyl)aminobenzene 5'-phosphate synthase